MWNSFSSPCCPKYHKKWRFRERGQLYTADGNGLSCLLATVDVAGLSGSSWLSIKGSMVAERERCGYVYISFRELSMDFTRCIRLRQLLWCWLHSIQTSFCCLGKHQFHCCFFCPPFLAEFPLVELHATVVGSVRQRLISFREKIACLHRTRVNRKAKNS